MTESGKNIGEKKEALSGSRLLNNTNGTERGGHKHLLENS